MARELHELRALVTTRMTGFLRGMERGAQATQKFRQSWATAGRDVSAAASRIGLAVTGMGAVVARTFAQFESTITRAGAVTRTLGTEDFERLQQAAKTMGETTVFSASQAAAAIEQMGLAGLKTDEIISALPGALQLASAAQVEIAEAADVAAKTMRAFGVEASELGHINDVMVATFTRANTTLGQLAEALTPVAPVSKALGVSLEDTAAAIAKMSDAGFQGGIAGTSLRNILSKMAGATPAVTNQLKALGVETLDSAGKMRPFLDILADIERAALTDAQILQLFGARGGPQLLALLEVGSQGLRDFSAELKESGGVAKEISEANLKTLSGQFTLLKSAIEGVVLEAGQRLRPTFEALIQSLVAFLNANRADVILAMESALQQMGNALLSLMQWLQDSGPALFEVAQQFGGFLAKIVEFLAAHPQLMAALLALKVTGLLGVNRALVSLGSAMLQTISTLAQLAAAAKTSTAAAAGLRAGLIGLKTAGVALLAVGMWKLADWMGLFGQATEGANENLELQNKLLAERARLEGSIAAKAIADAARIKDAGARRVALEKQLESIRRKSADMDRSAIAARNDADAAGDVFGANVPGTFASGNRDRLEKEAVEAEKRASRHAQAIADVEAEILRLKQQEKVEAEKAATARFDAEQAREAAAAVGHPGGAGDPAAAGGGDGAGAEAEQAAADAAENIADAIRQAQLQNMEEQNPGFGAMRNFAGMEGVTGSQLSQFSQTQGAGAGDAAALRTEFDGLRQQHGGQVPEQLVDDLIQRFVSKLNEASALTERAQEAANQFNPFVERLRELRDEGALSAETTSELAAKGRELAEQFRSGNLSADNFAQAMRGLQQATSEATEAARKEEEQKRREALIKGDFAGAGLNFQDALQDRIAQMQQQRFNAQVDQAANRYARLNGILPRVQQGFQSLHGGMQRFGRQLQRIPQGMGFGGGGGPQGAQQAFNTITSFLSSRDGQIAALRNQIALTQQRVNLFGERSADSFFSFGFGSNGYRQQREAERALKKLYGELNRILYQPPPQFTDMLGTGEEFFKDPGLQTQNVNVSLELPNLRRVTASDASVLSRAMTDEITRQGRRV